MGMPASTGKIAKEIEKPFFDNLEQRVGFPIRANYAHLESTGVKEFDQLRVLRSGLFEIVALRLGQVSRDEPTILGMDLVGQPQIANDPGIAGLILAQFLKNREAAIRAAMAAHQLAKARRLVNGGSHGLDRFVETYEKAMMLLPA